MSNESNNGGKKMNSNAALDFSQFDSMFEGIETPEVKDNIKPAEGVNENTVKITETSTTVDPIAVKSGVSKMQAIAMEMNNLFVEREQLIKIMQIALVTKTNLLMLGLPGTAKSFITYDMCGRIEGAKYFQWMLNKTSDPSEILGPFSVKQMENDHFMRITTGKLPEAHIAFMDEVYKSNAPTLNALLTIMNEHIFYNDGKPVDVPLMSMFGASNEPPEDESLLALHDRFIFRINLEYVHDAAGRKRMHSNYLDNRAGLINNSSKTKITLDELKALQNATLHVKVPRDIINSFIRFIDLLNRNYAIKVSDRRLNECLKVMQGSAVLEGRSTVGLNDFNSLLYVLWDKEDQIPNIEGEIAKIVNPYDEQFAKLKDSFNQIKSSIDNAGNDKDRLSKAVSSKSAMNRIVGRFNKLITEASRNGRDTQKFEEFRDNIVKYNDNVMSSTFDMAFPSSNNKANDTVNNSGDLYSDISDEIQF